MVTPTTPAPTINDTNIATLRTVVPALVGVLLTYLARWIAQRTGYQWNLSGVTEYVSPIAIALVATAYYKVVNYFEKKQPKLGWLLGYPATPSYNAAVQQIAAVVAAPPVDPAQTPPSMP